MMEKLKRCQVSLFVIALGILFLTLALRIRRNPVRLQGAINYLAQAKFLPIAAAVIIILLGIALLVFDMKKHEPAAATDGAKERRRYIVLTLLMIAYCLSAWRLGLLLPTIAYLNATLFYINWNKKHPGLLISLSIVYTLAALFAVPRLLNLSIMLW